MNQVDKLIADVNETALWHEVLVLNSSAQPGKKRRTIMNFCHKGHLTQMQAELLLESLRAGDSV